MLLDDAVDALVAANGDRAKLAHVLYTVVNQRTHVMHERAQVAEGRWMKAERRLVRLSEFVGFTIHEDSVAHGRPKG